MEGNAWTPVQALLAGVSAVVACGLALGAFGAWVYAMVAREQRARAAADNGIWQAIEALRDHDTTVERRLGDKMENLATKTDLSDMEGRLMDIMRAIGGKP